MTGARAPGGSGGPDGPPPWHHLVALMTVGTGEEPALRGTTRTWRTDRAEDVPAARETDEDDVVAGGAAGTGAGAGAPPSRDWERRSRVWARGHLRRVEDLDGRPRAVAGEDTLWMFGDDDPAPLALARRSTAWGIEEGVLLDRRPLEDFRGDDFTRPLGPPEPTSLHGRDAWRVRLAAPEHKSGVLEVVVDAVTGLLLSARNDARGGAEWLELEVGPEPDPALFVWDGPSRPFGDPQEEGRAQERRDLAWLAEQGLSFPALPVEPEVRMHVRGEDGSFVLSLEYSQYLSLQRRPRTDAPWGDAAQGAAWSHRWSDAAWDWAVSGPQAVPAVVGRVVVETADVVETVDPADRPPAGGAQPAG